MKMAKKAEAKVLIVGDIDRGGVFASFFGTYALLSPEEKELVSGFLVIDLPHISNFTNFDSVMIEPDIFLRIISAPDTIGNPNLIILPGSKNVLGDISYLKEKGYDKEIVSLAKRGKTIFGICSGFQILGREIEDPLAVESTRISIKGIGVLFLLDDGRVEGVRSKDQDIFGTYLHSIFDFDPFRR